MPDRRHFLALTALGAVGILIPNHLRALSLAKTPMTIYKSPTCGCCGKWVEHVRAAGFIPNVVEVDDPARLNELKQSSGVPQALWSCHTALVGNYVVEGHVPADLVSQMLREKPQGRGLAVPGMVGGSPGMEIPGTPAGHYDVLLFQRNGTTRVYASR